MGNKHDSWLSFVGIDVGKIVTDVWGSTIHSTPGASSPAAAKAAGGGLALSGSVGKGGKNDPDDVKAVQGALNRLAHAALSVDGDCGSQTIKAIKAFQKSLGTAKPDGRVDPGKATARALAGGAPAGPSPAGPPPAPVPPPAPSPLTPRKLELLPPRTDEDEDSPSFIDQVEKKVDEVEDFFKNLVNPATDDISEVEDEIDAKHNAKITASILKKLKTHGNLKAEVQVLEGTKMRPLLDIMDRLKKAGKLQDFAGAETSNPKVGAAMFTVLRKFEGEWSTCVSKLSAEDRKVIFERTPDDVKKSSGLWSDPKEPHEKEDDDEGGGTITVGRDTDIEATLRFETEHGSVGETELTVKVDPMGKLKAIELDLELIGATLNRMGPFPNLVLDVSVSLAASVELTEEQSRTIVEKVRAEVKAQVELYFRKMKRVRLRFWVSGGPEGFNFGPALVIKFP